MRHLTLSSLLVGALALAPRAARAQEPPASCTVAYVLDGDTINCKGGATVRLLLIDAPDRGDFGEQARAYVVGLAPKGTDVRLEYDEVPQDGDGRWLAYAYLQDGTFLNKRLVEKGFAYVEFSAKNHARLQELRSAERVARAQKMGLWAE